MHNYLEDDYLDRNDGRKLGADDQSERTERLNTTNKARGVIDPWISFPERRPRPSRTFRQQVHAR